VVVAGVVPSLNGPGDEYVDPVREWVRVGVSLELVVRSLDGSSDASPFIFVVPERVVSGGDVKVVLSPPPAPVPLDVHSYFFDGRLCCQPVCYHFEVVVLLCHHYPDLREAHILIHRY